MSRFCLISAWAVMLVLLICPQSWGQQGAAGLGPAVNVSGLVVAVTKTTPKEPGKPVHVIMILKTDQGNTVVFLGPADYVDRQTVKILKQDKVQVRGYKITYEQKALFLASEVRRGDKTLRLRDESGRPLWPQAKAGFGGM